VHNGRHGGRAPILAGLLQDTAVKETALKEAAGDPPGQSNRRGPPMPCRMVLPLLAAALMGLAAALPARADAGEAARAGRLCEAAVAAAERMRPELPRHLLGALSKVESGRWVKPLQARVAWPWTVMAEGRGRYLPTKAAALREVRQLQARGVSNIDVGCMQVNLHWHGDAFASLEEAFDPAHNVAYAAAFLLHLKQQERSWTKAIGVYHSHTPRYSGPYRIKVFRAWREEKKAAYAERAARRADG
jgi:hypothetical protein